MRCKWLIVTLVILWTSVTSVGSKRFLRLKRLEEAAETLRLDMTDIAQSVDKLYNKLDDVLARLEELANKGGGGIYVRWGRSDCPDTSELVYSGYAGGSHWKHTGAAANYICLTKDPKYGYVEPGTQDAGGLVYGAEYEPYRKNPKNFVGKNMDDEDVPCAVCRSNQTSVVMIPGRNACSSDSWTLEYSGYLSSGKISHAAASEFVCLDGHPYAISKPEANVDGKLFYFVEGRCGSLNCPPYENGYELTCAVCSK